MVRLHVRYSENFGNAKTASLIYSRLKDKNLSPILITMSYSPKIRRGEAIYYFFEESCNFPDKSELTKILKGIKLDKLTLEEQ